MPASIALSDSESRTCISRSLRSFLMARASLRTSEKAFLLTNSSSNGMLALTAESVTPQRSAALRTLSIIVFWALSSAL